MDLAPRAVLPAVLAAAAAVGGLPAFAAGVVARDGVEVSVLPTVGPAHANQSVVRVALDVEARTDAAARRLGFRSLRGVTDIDCRSGENQFVKAEAFDHADLRGQARGWPVLGDWGRPTATSYMFSVTEHVCGKAAFEGPAPVVSAAEPAQAATPAATDIARGGRRGAPQPAPPPIHLVAHDDQPPPESAREMVASAEPPPTPTASTVPAPTHAAPAHIVTAHAGAAPAVRAPSFLVSSSRGGGPLVAQITASPSAADAQHALAVLHGLIAPPLAAVVEAAEISGARVYRATVTGFASAADARAFCARAGVKSCWVRPPTSGAATPANHARATPPSRAHQAAPPTPLRGRF